VKFAITKSDRKDTQSAPDEHYKVNNTNPKVNSEISNLDKLPKEFKKKFYDGFEPRFVIILLSSIFTHFALALFLSTHFTP